MRYFNHSWWRYLSLAFLVVAVGCGSGSSSSDGGGTSTTSITTLSEVPRATDPVSDESSASGSAMKSKRSYLATTGMTLGTTPSFDENSSLAACEMYNQTKQAIAQAAEGDLILCYIQSVMAAAEDIPAVIQDENGDAVSGIDIYDGDAHAFGLELDESEEGDNGGPDHIKFSIARDTDGVITAFTMYACRAGTQFMYLNQTIDGTTFSMTSKGTYNDQGDSGTFSGSYHTVVTGTLDSDGAFTGEKPIRMRFTNDWDQEMSGGSSWGDITFTQGSDSAELSGYMDGSNDFDGSTFDWINRIVGSLQLIDGNTDADNYNLGLLALGEGAVLGQMSGSGDQGDSWDDSFEEAWDGDTALSLESSDFLDDLDGLALPSATEPTIAFEGDEAYDCGDTEEATISFVEANINPDEACSDLSLNQEWTDCWSTIGDPQQ